MVSKAHDPDRFYFSEISDLPNIGDLNKTFYDNINSVHSWNTIPFGPLVYGLVYGYLPGLVIETGTNYGYITAWVAKACLELKIPFYTIDVGEEFINSAKYNIDRCGVLNGVTEFVNADVISYMAAIESSFFLRALGLVIIDDLHEERHVYKELEVFWKHLVPGGIIILHDTIDIQEINCAVCKFINNKDIKNRLWFFISSGYIVIQKNK